MAPTDKPSKTMSSRLLTMKFMQRAAASSPSSTANTSDERSSKRQRLSAPSSAERNDMQAVQEALAAEDLKRTQALERQAAEAGESKWVLNIPGQVEQGGFNVVSAGYGAIDTNGAQLNGEEEDADMTEDVARYLGRKNYGNFGKKEKTQEVEEDEDEESDAESESGASGEDDDDDGEHRKRKIPSEAAEQFKAKRQARKQAERADAAMLAERRRNKEVKLNRLSGISSGGGQKPRGSPLSAGSDMKCFNCGGPHRKKDCPKLGNRR